MSVQAELKQSTGEQDAAPTSQAPEATAGKPAEAQSMNGPGGVRPTGIARLPADLRSKMEASLGADLSAVRIHTDAPEAEGVGAKAFTRGHDIFFAPGAYDPSSAEGERLIAHEVAHTVQQGGAQEPAAKMDVSTPGDAGEVEADKAADAMTNGGSANVTAGKTSGIIQRQVKGGGTDAKAPADDVALRSTLKMISFRYGDILIKQTSAMEDLTRALTAPDVPSFSEQMLSFAIQAALGAAFGAAGSLIGAAIGKYAGAAAGATVKAGGTKLEVPKDAYVPPGMSASDLSPIAGKSTSIAASVSKKVEDVIAGGFGKLAEKAVGSVKGLPPVEQFVSGQKESLENAAVTARDAFIVHEHEFLGKENGLQEATALLLALDDALAKAKKEQLMASIVQWSKLLHNPAGGKTWQDKAGMGFETGVLVVEFDADAKGANSNFKSTWPGLNQKAREVIKSTYTDKQLIEANPIIKMKVKTKDFSFAITSFGPGDVQYPISGQEAMFLTERAGGKPGSQDDNLARVGAYLILNDIGTKKFSDIGLSIT